MIKHGAQIKKYLSVVHKIMKTVLTITKRGSIIGHINQAEQNAGG